MAVDVDRIGDRLVFLGMLKNKTGAPLAYQVGQS